MATINPYTGKPVSRDGFVYFLEGSTGTGKTTNIQNILDKIPLPKYAIDFSGEYRKYGIRTTDISKVRIKEVLENFKFQMVNKWESVIIFSEAGIYFKNKKQMDEEMSLILKEARKRGNYILADFHKLSEIPIDMLGLSDKLIMKRSTMETQGQLKKFFHYKEIKKAFYELMNDETNVVVNGKKYFIASRQIDTKKLTVSL